VSVREEKLDVKKGGGMQHLGSVQEGKDTRHAPVGFLLAGASKEEGHEEKKKQKKGEGPRMAGR